MKSNKGITLTSLVIYIIVATIVISIMAMVSSFFFSNMNLVKDQDQYAVEFNKFNMFFITDIKNNTTAQVESNKITLEDGTIYEYKQKEGKIYRNNTEIAKEINTANFASSTYTIPNTSTIKNLITIQMSIGKNRNFNKTIEYVLKYW